VRKKRILTIEGLLKGFDVDKVVLASTEERVDTSVIGNNVEIFEKSIPAWLVAEATVAVSVDHPLQLKRSFRNPTLWRVLITQLPLCPLNLHQNRWSPVTDRT